MKRRLFSKDDGTTTIQDISAMTEEFKAWFNHLPLEIKKLMPIAEKAVRFLQELDDMLEEGHPVNEALEKVLAMTKTEVDDKAYEVFKQYVARFADFAENLIQDLDGVPTGEDKFKYASGIVQYVCKVSELQADTAAQLAVYAIKG